MSSSSLILGSSAAVLWGPGAPVTKPPLWTGSASELLSCQTPLPRQACALAPDRVTKCPFQACAQGAGWRGASTPQPEPHAPLAAPFAPSGLVCGPFRVHLGALLPCPRTQSGGGVSEKPPRPHPGCCLDSRIDLGPAWLGRKPRLSAVAFLLRFLDFVSHVERPSSHGAHFEIPSPSPPSPRTCTSPFLYVQASDGVGCEVWPRKSHRF